MSQLSELNKRVVQKIRKVNDCWLFEGRTNSGGFGFVEERRNGRSMVFMAHRVTWAYKNGYMPKGNLFHTCDNKLCVRADHLELRSE